MTSLGWNLAFPKIPKVAKFLQPLSNWLVFLIAGLSIGLLSGVLSILSVWLANLKSGRCVDNLSTLKTTCVDWREWSDWSILNYFIYILFSIFFAFVAAFAVHRLSQQASGSGISEIKCIIAGVDYPGYLHWPVLAVKACTLVGSWVSQLTLSLITFLSTATRHRLRPVHRQRGSLSPRCLLHRTSPSLSLPLFPQKHRQDARDSRRCQCGWCCVCIR